MLLRNNDCVWISWRTGTAKHHRILCVLSTQFLHCLVHWNKSSINDRARKDRLSGHVAFSKDKLACDAVDTVRSNDSICLCGAAVLEMENHAAAFFVLNGLKAFVEVCTFSGYSFDEFIEKSSSMYALHAAFSLLGTDDFAVVLALALIEKDRISTLQVLMTLSSKDCAKVDLLQRTR